MIATNTLDSKLDWKKYTTFSPIESFGLKLRFLIFYLKNMHAVIEYRYCTVLYSMYLSYLFAIIHILRLIESFMLCQTTYSI
jgi:hypothetical protein